MNAFATAMNVIFADANMAVDALWFAGGTGPGIVVRVIRKSPDEVTGVAERRAEPSWMVIVVVLSCSVPARL